MRGQSAPQSPWPQGPTLRLARTLRSYVGLALPALARGIHSVAAKAQISLLVWSIFPIIKTVFRAISTALPIVIAKMVW